MALLSTERRRTGDHPQIETCSTPGSRGTLEPGGDLTSGHVGSAWRAASRPTAA